MKPRATIRLNIDEDRRVQYMSQARQQEKSLKAWIIDALDVACITGRQIEAMQKRDWRETK